jgi:hypothetical protein
MREVIVLNGEREVLVKELSPGRIVAIEDSGPALLPNPAICVIDPPGHPVFTGGWFLGSRLSAQVLVPL